mmetsp:Transcript_11762/g.16162  ORF Transcript_11762/g.16162 Transcript_11762/m.16162 type:complete len:235 (+) Transcript_11762:844-1548(+)
MDTCACDCVSELFHTNVKPEMFFTFTLKLCAISSVTSITSSGPLFVFSNISGIFLGGMVSKAVAPPSPGLPWDSNSSPSLAINTRLKSSYDTMPSVWMQILRIKSYIWSGDSGMPRYSMPPYSSEQLRYPLLDELNARNASKISIPFSISPALTLSTMTLNSMNSNSVCVLNTVTTGTEASSDSCFRRLQALTSVHHFSRYSLSSSASTRSSTVSDLSSKCMSLFRYRKQLTID